MNRLRAAEVPIQELLDRIDEAVDMTGATDRLTSSFGGGGEYDAFVIRAYLRRRVENGQHMLAAPLPPANQRPGGGWIGEFYSPDRLMRSWRSYIISPRGHHV